jgi:hypothetical protein
MFPNSGDLAAVQLSTNRQIGTLPDASSIAKTCQKASKKITEPNSLFPKETVKIAVAAALS